MVYKLIVFGYYCRMSIQEFSACKIFSKLGARTTNHSSVWVLHFS